MRIVITRRGQLDIPDGINTFIFSLAEELIQRGVDVYAISDIDNSHAKIAEFYQTSHLPSIVSLGSASRSGHFFRVAYSSMTWARSGRSAISALNPDLTIVNGALPFGLPGNSATVTHDGEFRGRKALRRAFKAYAYRRSTHIVATCSELKRALSQEIHKSEPSIRKIPTCVNLDAYLQSPLSHRQQSILHIGTAPYKNPTASVEAFSRMTSEAATLLITGTPTHELQTALSRLTTPVRNRIKILGYVPAEELKALLANVRIVLCPSIYSVPVASPTVLEAFASGTPVVVSPSISQDLINSQLLQRVQTDNTESIAASADSILANDDVWYEQSIAGLESVQQFSSVNVANLYIDLVDS